MRTAITYAMEAIFVGPALGVASAVCSIYDIISGNIASVPSIYTQGGGTITGDYIGNITISFGGSSIFTNSDLGTTSYLDLSSAYMFSITAGQSYTLNYTTGASYPQGIAVYMQNSFGSWIRIGGSLLSSVSSGSFQITIPTGISGSNRMIVRSYYQLAGINDLALDVSRQHNYGQRKDFRVCVGNPSEIPSVAKLDFIQSYDFSFDVERSALKQIGSAYLATRQTQLAPDVNLNLQYYLNRGWNEKFIGMDVGVTANGYRNPFSSIFTSNPDRNFYVVIAQDNGRDLNADTSFDGHNLLGIGNVYLTNYELSVGLNSLATVNLSFVGANAEISQVSSATFENPALFVSGSGTEVITNQSIGILDGSRSSRYMTGYSGLFAGGCPHGGCQITATSEAAGEPDYEQYVYAYNDLISYYSDNIYPTISIEEWGKLHYTENGQAENRQVPLTKGNAVKLGFDFDNFQSLSISVPIERKALYGFGNNHPFNRKVQKPIVGNLNIDSLVDSFTAENLAKSFQKEDVSISGYLFDIVFSNQANVKKFGVKVQNARLDSYSIGSTIGDRSVISTSWSFEVNESTGILMSGSYSAPVATAGFITEAINL